MKTAVCLFLSIIFALTLNAQAVPGHGLIPETSTVSIQIPQLIRQTKSLTKATAWALDSMLSYKSTNNQMQLYRKMFVKAVDQYANPYKLITIILDNNTNQWINSDSTIMSYYAHDKTHTLLSFSWNKCNNQWSDTTHYKELTESKKYITYIFRNWDYTNCKFTSGYKHSYTINDDGNYDSILIFKLDTANNVWVKSKKKTYFYYTENLIYNILEQKWNHNKEQWENYQKIEDEYNQDKQLITENYLVWNNIKKQWQYSMQKVLSYDNNGWLINIVTKHWDYINNKWVNSSRILIHYTANTQTTTYQSWDANNSQWVNTSQFIFNYNNTGKLLEQIDQLWDSNNNKWDNTDKYEYVYDSADNQTEYNYYQWNTGSWVLKSQDKFFYSQMSYNGIASVKMNIKISPNPAYNELVIYGLTKGEYKITTLSGKTLMHSKLHSNRINIQALPSGIYILEIKNDNKKYYSRFIKL